MKKIAFAVLLISQTRTRALYGMEINAEARPLSNAQIYGPSMTANSGNRSAPTPFENVYIRALKDCVGFWCFCCYTGPTDREQIERKKKFLELLEEMHPTAFTMHKPNKHQDT